MFHWICPLLILLISEGFEFQLCIVIIINLRTGISLAVTNAKENTTVGLKGLVFVLVQGSMMGEGTPVEYIFNQWCIIPSVKMMVLEIPFLSFLC